MNIIKVTTTSSSGEGSLANAIATAANLPGLDIIDFSEIAGSEILIGSLPQISGDNDLKFLGFGVTLNGGNSGNILTINGANVTLNNLSLVGGSVQGGNGSRGAGGNLGAGGAIFIDSASGVVFNNVAFSSNSAIGGDSTGRAGSGGRGAGIGGDGASGGDGSASNSGGDGGECSGFLCSSPESGDRGSSGSSGAFGVGGRSAGGGGGGSDGASGGRGGTGGRGGFGGGGGAGGGGGGRGTGLGSISNGSGGSGGSGGSFGGSGSAGSSGSGGGAISRGSGGSGGSGGGGAGLGGAVFVNSGASLTIIDSSFTNNRAVGGDGANDGQGEGGAIFIRSGANVTGSNLSFLGNDASDSATAFSGFGSFQDNDDLYGTINELVFPSLDVVAGTTPREIEEVGGSFEIELNSAFPVDLVVGYTIGGAAIAELDYEIPDLTFSSNTGNYGGTVIIPAGRTNVSLDVLPKDDIFFDLDETVLITLLSGENYQLGITQATLVIDDDEPEVSFVENVTIAEGTTGNVAVRLNKPAPRGGLVVNYDVSGNATPEDDYLSLEPGKVFIPEGSTSASIEITALQDGVNNESNETIELSLTEVTNSDGEILNYGVGGNNIATVAIANINITPPSAANQIVIQETENSTDVVEGGASDFYLVALGSQPSENVAVNISTDSQIENISSLTFTPDNWNTFQPVRVVAVEDDTAEENHTSQITHNANGYETRQLTVNISEVIDTQETASGLEEALTQLQEIIEDQLLSLEIPLVGSLGDLAPDFIGTFKDTVINKIATAKNLTVDALRDLLKTEIETAFSNTGIDLEVTVSPNISAEEATFDLTIGNLYNLSDTNLSSDLGIPALGLAIDGQAVMDFDYGLNLSFGIHKDFGFFLDTTKTELTTGVTLELSDDFAAQGTLGLLQIDVLDNVDNPTQANVEFGFALNDLDNSRDIRYFDANENDELDDDEVFVEKKDDGTYDDFVVDGDTKTAAELKEIVLQPDGDRLTKRELARDDYEFSDLFTPVLDGSLSLGLSSETKLEGVEALPSFAYDLAASWDVFGYDDLGVFQDVGVPNISFDNLLVDLDTFISDFAKPVLENISDLIDPIRPIIDVLNTDTKLFTALGINNLFGKKLDENNNNQVSLIELVAAIPGSRIATGFVDAVTKVTDLLDLIGGIDSSNSEPITIDLGSFDLGSFTDDLDTSNLVATAKDTVENAIEQIERLPGNNRKEVITGFTGDPTIEIPLLTDPTVAIGLLLDQPGINLFNYDFPELGVFLELSQNFPIFGPLSGLLQGRIDIGANLNFGFDTVGLNQWQDLGYAIEESSRVFDGFFINDLNSNGVDVPEIIFDATLAAGAGIDILALSGYLTGGIKGEIEVDLVDVGESNGTSDGRVRGAEITSRLDTPWELFDIAGTVSAFLGAEVQAFRQTVYSNHFATFPLLEFNLGASGNSLGVGSDGYIAGGTVFFDANFNKTLDANEPFTITNVDGTYDLDIPLYLYDVDRSDRLEPEEGQIVIIDGVDISTNLPQTTPLVVIPDVELTTNSASSDSAENSEAITVNTVVSPLTTLVAQLSQPDFEPIQANLIAALDLPTGINYLNYDPLIAIFNNENSDAALKVLAQTAKLQNYLFQTTQIISDASDLTPEEIAFSLLDLIATKVTSGNRLNLEELESMRNLINEGIAKTKELDPELTLSGAVKFVAAQTISNNNLEIANIVTNSEQDATTKAELIGASILAPDISAEITQIAIAPLDTIIRSLAESKMSLDESQAIVRSNFGLPNLDLLNYDALAEIRQGDEQGLEVFTEQVKVQNTIVGVADFLETQVNDPEVDTANIFIESFANNLQASTSGNGVLSVNSSNSGSSGNPNPLSNASVIDGLIDDTLNSVSVDNSDSQASDISLNAASTTQETTPTQDELATNIQQNNQRIDEIAADSSLTLSAKALQIAQVQQSAQSTENSDIESSPNTANNPSKVLDIANSVPVAEPDVVNTDGAGSITINVLANDRDADDDNLTITEVYGVTEDDEIIPKEEITINEDGTLTYTPSSNFTGEDNFYYVITDGKGDFANAEVTIRPSELTTPIYRFQNSSVPGTYLFVGEAERANILQNFTNFVEEGFAFRVGEAPGENVIPLYRFQSRVTPGTYLFVGEQERAGINANFSESFTEEGLAFYVYNGGANLGTTFYRFQNSGLPGTYLFAGGTERANILEDFPAFIEEGIAFEVEV